MKKTGYFWICLCLFLLAFCRSINAFEGEEIEGLDVAVLEEGTETVSGNDASTSVVVNAPSGQEYATVSGNDRLPENKLPEEILSFQVPPCLDFVMDPFEIYGQGQIFSKEYYFKNQGSQTIRIKLSSIQCIVAENVTALGDSGSMEDILQSPEKLVQLQILFGTGERLAVTEEAGRYEMILEPGQSVSARMAGRMSSNPEYAWKTGDVTISLTYHIEPISNGIIDMH